MLLPGGVPPNSQAHEEFYQPNVLLPRRVPPDPQIQESYRPDAHDRPRLDMELSSASRCPGLGNVFAIATAVAASS